MSLLALLVAFLAMEAVTYCAHRWVMHGVGWVLHRSHHRRLATRFEANDFFPLIFSAVALLLFAVAIQWNPLWSVCWGITLYGAVYVFVHDVYIHDRLPLPRKLFGFLEPLKQAHMVHHRFNNEPYGMLLPYIPARLRMRAEDQRARGIMPVDPPTRRADRLG